MVTRRRIEPRRRAQPSGRRSARRGGRLRDRRWILGALAATGVGGALAVGLGVTYVSGGGVIDDKPAPTRLEADPLSPTSTTLSWRSTGAEKYVVRVGSDRALKAARTATVTGSRSSLTLADIAPTTPGTDQYFRVDAVDGDEVIRSRTVRFLLPPGAARKTDVRRVSANGFAARWSKVPNARQYDVQVARDAKFTKPVSTVRTLDAAPAIVVKKLKPGTKYHVRVRPSNGELLGRWGPADSFRTKVPSVSFRVAGWNVCSEACSGYGSRSRDMAAYLNANDVDLFALQEAGGERVGPTTAAAFSGGERGFRLATGGGEARYIFFRPKLFEQLGGGHFGIGGGKWATWARFKAKEGGRTFVVVSVHLVTGKDKVDGKRAAQTRSMLDQMAAINTEDDPIVYAGDFNSGVHRANSPGRMIREAGMVDSIDVAAEKINTEYNSGHTMGTSVPRSGDYVDHVYVSKQFQVTEWKQLVRLSGNRYASPVLTDHNPITAVLALDTKIAKLGDETPTTVVPDLPAAD